MIKIELTDEESSLFKSFRKHQDIFDALINGEVFNTKNGVVTLNFNQDGVLTEIRKDFVTYKKLSTKFVRPSN